MVLASDCKVGSTYGKERLGYLKDLEGNYLYDCSAGKHFTGTTMVELENINL